MPGVGKRQGEPYVKSWKMEPLQIAVLAGLTPQDIKTRFFDDRCEAIFYDEPTDLVAINAETYTAKRAYAIAGEFRRRAVPVVLGGFHPTLVQEEAGRHADAVVVGEVEGVWLQLVNDFKTGRMQKVYRSSQRPCLAGIKPRREIFEGRGYLPIVLMESARGCTHSCNFCSITRFFNKTCAGRPVEDIVCEIAAIKAKNVFFVDDNIVADTSRAKAFFEALIPLGISWIGQATVCVAQDEGLLKLMKKSGCVGLLIGFESLNRQTLAHMGKVWNLQAGGYEESLQKFRDTGIAVYGTFVFGYKGDTKDSIQRSLDFALKQKFFMAAFNHLVPFPGTPLYEQLRLEGRLLYDAWWLDPAYSFGDVAFRPLHMSPEKLAAACLDARKEFYQFSSILRRGMDLKVNCSGKMLPLYFSLNFFSRQEVRSRQGLLLGEGMESGQK